jgi:hypothetical protein
VLELLWRYSVHHAAEVFAADGDDCFFTSRGTWLISLAVQTGEERWRARVHNPWGSLAVTRDSVFYLNQHSLLVALDRVTGEARWSRDLVGVNGWLHAGGERVVVGGWRGYTDILALAACDGTTVWRHAARGQALHSTRIHVASHTLVVADSANGGQVSFLDLHTGQERRRIEAPGTWRETFVEHPTSTGHPDVAVILTQGEQGLAVVRWSQPRPTLVVPGRSVWSMNITCARHVVPFLTREGQLVVWSIENDTETEFGKLEHNRRDQLPFVALDDRKFVVGTSFGWLEFLSGTSKNKLRVGKRVSTDLAMSGPIITFGSGSGEVMGVRWRNDA